MIDYHYFAEDHLMLSVFHGHISGLELNELIDKLLAVEHQDGVMRGLTLLCENVKMSGLKYNDVFSAGKRMKAATFREHGKNAIVAQTSLAYGLSRIYQAATEISSLDETKVYKGDDGFAEAIAWLGITGLNDQIQQVLVHDASNRAG